MALYLRTALHDYGLLPFPSPKAKSVDSKYGNNNENQVKFDYSTLLKVAASFAKLTRLTFGDWVSISQEYMGLNEEMAKVYFEGFLLMIDQADDFRADDLYQLISPNSNHQEPSDEIAKHRSISASSPLLHPHLLTQYAVSPTPFILFLFNQLYSAKSPSLYQSFSTDDNSEVDSSFYPSKNMQTAGGGSLKRSKSHYSKTYWKRIPKEMMVGRRALSNYWKTNTMKWIHLLQVSTTRGHNSMDRNLGLSRSQLKFINFVFIGIVPISEEGCEDLRYQFGQWAQTGKDAEGSKKCRDLFMADDFGEFEHHGEVFSTPVEEILISMAEQSLTLSARKTSVIPTELVDSVISWCLLDTPMFFQRILFSPKGVAYGLEESKVPLGKSFESSQVLISGKRNQTLVITQEFVQNAHVFIYRCHDCRIFILAPSANTSISYCRGTEVFFGVATKNVHVHHCDNSIIRGVCSRLMVSMCQSLSAYVTSMNRPLVFCNQKDGQNLQNSPDQIQPPFSDTVSKISSPPLILAPCNGWYDNMDVHMSDNNMDPVLSNWYPPVVVWNNSSVQPLFCKLDPSQFFCNEIPFSYNPNQARVCGGMNHPPNPIPLPKEYSDWVFKTVEFVYDAKNLLDGLKTSDKETPSGQLLEQLRHKINAEFRKWLESSGNIHLLTSLLNIDKDVQQMKMHVTIMD